MTALLHELLDAAAARHGDRVAVRADGECLTYAGLADRSRRLAGWLDSLGTGRGDRVVLALTNGVDVPALIYACSRIGAVSVPLRRDTPAAVAAHACADAQPTLVVTDSPDLREVARSHGIAACEVPGVEELPEQVSKSTVLAVDPAFFIYTSGSTAMPKAVVSTHQQMTFAAEAIQSRLRYRPDDVVYCPLPLSFDYGLYQIFLCTLAGAQLHLATAENAGHRLLVDLAAAGAGTGKRATIMEPDEDLARPGSCGRALPGTEVLVVDEDGARRPPGEVGEVVVRGPHVMSGYWRQPEMTAWRFPRVHGLFPELRTGDYGWLDDAGYLYFVGRRDDMYKERGFRVSVIEVEAAALRVPGVRAAVVVPPASDAPGATLLVESDLTAREVLAALRGELDEVKAPARCLVVAELPLNANGKIERNGLARLVSLAGMEGPAGLAGVTGHG